MEAIIQSSEVVPFPGLRARASLKLRLRAHETHGGVHPFPGVCARASLKRQLQGGDQRLEIAPFPGLRARASLKQLEAGRADAEDVAIPGPSRPGLIEARPRWENR